MLRDNENASCSKDIRIAGVRSKVIALPAITDALQAPDGAGNAN